MNAENELRMGYQYQKERAFEKALECFRSACARPDERERALLEIGKTYKMMSMTAEAVDALIELLRSFPGSAEGIRELGEAARYSNECSKAISFLEQLAGDGKGVRASLELCRVHSHAGDTAKARGALDPFMRANPDAVEVHVELGKIYKREGRLDLARGELEKAMSVSPEDREACYELGDVHFQLGDRERAARCFEKIASGPHPDKETNLKLVEIYALQEDIERSERAAREALRLTWNDPFSQDAVRNEIEILQRKTVLASTVKRLWVTVTTRCNIRCKTCGVWRSLWDLPYGTAKEVMALYPYLERVVWLGGEVFLYKHFEEMFDEAARHRNLTQQIITNGVILNERWTEKIIASGNTELTFSVDGMTKDVYENIRRGANFEKLLASIRRAMAVKKKLDSPIHIRMNAVIMRSNYRQMEQLLDFARDEGFDQVSLMALHFNMDPEENIFDEGKDDEIRSYIGAAIPRLRQKAKEYGIDLDILLPPAEQVRERDGDEKRENAALRPPAAAQALNPPRPPYCRRPWQYLMICDKGDVIMTGSCVKPVGNISSRSITEIWNSAESQLYRKRMIEHAPEGICRAECRSRFE